MPCGTLRSSAESPPALKHGVFIHVVIEGWKVKSDEEANRDGKLSLDELAKDYHK
jgi:hypothetical protein